MDELKTIGGNIVKIRKRLRLSQEDVAGLAEIDRSHLSDIENGKANVTIKGLSAIAKALGVKPIDLMRR